MPRCQSSHEVVETLGAAPWRTIRAMRPDFPFRPAATPFYYGWVIVAVSTVGIVMSAPGQTIGVSVFTESLLEATGLSRVEFSNTYLVGTLLSALLLPLAGSTLDRVGARRGVIWAAMGLGLMLAYMSQVDRFALSATRAGLPAGPTTLVCITIGFLGLRFCGQGVLMLVCRTMLGRWFERKRGLVSAITGPFSNLSFASSPVLLSWWVADSGWRGAWLEMSLVLCVGMTIFGWLFFRNSPEECGLEVDGGPGPAPAPGAAPRPASRDFTRAEAIRTTAFWIVALGIGNHAMVGTGMSFHIVDLAGEAGLSPTDAFGLFVPVTLISVPTGIVVGGAIDRLPIRYLLMSMMVGQALMFGFAPHLGDPTLRALCIAGWGFSGGFYGPLTIAAIPSFFGRTHLGAIQAVLMMVIVVASALGPALLAAGKASFGSYAPALHALAFLPLGIFLVAPFTRAPQHASANGFHSD
jgi:OFA family oxalate/formate antiporter-like MFS transporter